MRSKWAKLVDERSYRLVDLGRPANFLLPSHKLRTKAKGSTIENDLHEFLVRHFGAFNTSTLPTAGFWRSDGKQVVYDECRQYEVSFLGKEKIPLLLKKLAKIAEAISEDCIYFKAGQYTCLVFPPSKNERSKSGKKKNKKK